MTGRKEVARKVIGKTGRKLNPGKLDMKKKMGEVKLFGGLLAEVTAVQAELTVKMDDGLLRSERNSAENLKGLQITAHQLQQANILGAQLNAMVQNYVDGLLDVLDLAGNNKGI